MMGFVLEDHSKHSSSVGPARGALGPLALGAARVSQGACGWLAHASSRRGLGTSLDSAFLFLFLSLQPVRRRGACLPRPCADSVKLTSSPSDSHRPELTFPKGSWLDPCSWLTFLGREEGGS